MKRPRLRLTSSRRKRRFAREVGGVVLGVLIALSAAEAAGWLRWKLRIARGFEAVKVELAENRGVLLERRTYQRCLDRRIAEIGAVLTGAQQTGILPAIANIGRPGMRPIQRTAFDVAAGEGVLLNADRQIAARYTAAYVLAVDAYREQTMQEQEAWITLQLLEQKGGPVSSDMLAMLFDAWAGPASAATGAG